MYKLLTIMLLCVIMFGCVEYRIPSVEVPTTHIEIPVDNQGI